MIHLTAFSWAWGCLSKPVQNLKAKTGSASRCPKGRLLCSWLLIASVFWTVSATDNTYADTQYQSPADFVQQVFNLNADEAPLTPSVIWLDKSLQESISAILGHPYPQARLRYWCKAETCVWILDEIGKEFPITAGFVVQGDTLRRAQVLIYRESRGMEIHLPRYLDQFRDLHSANNQLSRKIDGISGATLSCRAMTKMARLALFLNQQVSDKAGHY